MVVASDDWSVLWPACAAHALQLFDSLCEHIPLTEAELPGIPNLGDYPRRLYGELILRVSASGSPAVLCYVVLCWDSTSVRDQDWDLCCAALGLCTAKARLVVLVVLVSLARELRNES